MRCRRVRLDRRADERISRTAVDSHSTDGEGKKENDMSLIKWRSGKPYHATCGHRLFDHWDTEADAPYWHCDECQESVTTDGREAVCGTNIPKEEVPK